MTTGEAARLIGVSKSTISGHCASGRIKASRVPPVYQQMVELGKRTTMARLCYAIRRLCALLDDDHWQQHVAYVAQRQAARRRPDEQ